MAVLFAEPAWVDLIADRLAARVAAGAGVPRDRVFEYLGRPDDVCGNPPGDQFVVVGGPELPCDDGYLTGGGAELSVFRGRWPLHVFARLATDKQRTDVRYLRDRSRGLGRLARRVAAAVQQWHGATDEDPVSHLLEPARVLGLDFSPRTAPQGWGWCTVRLEATFRADLTQPPPAD